MKAGWVLCGELVKQLVIFPKGTLSPADKKAMRKAGFVPVETDDPSKVVTHIAGMEMSGDDLTMAALDAMEGTGGFQSAEFFRARFADNLHKRLKKRSLTP